MSISFYDLSYSSPNFILFFLLRHLHINKGKIFSCRASIVHKYSYVRAIFHSIFLRPIVTSIILLFTTKNVFEYQKTLIKLIILFNTSIFLSTFNKIIQTMNHNKTPYERSK